MHVNADVILTSVVSKMFESIVTDVPELLNASRLKTPIMGLRFGFRAKRSSHKLD